MRLQHDVGFPIYLGSKSTFVIPNGGNIKFIHMVADSVQARIAGGHFLQSHLPRMLLRAPQARPSSWFQL